MLIHALTRKQAGSLFQNVISGKHQILFHDAKSLLFFRMMKSDVGCRSHHKLSKDKTQKVSTTSQRAVYTDVPVGSKLELRFRNANFPLHIETVAGAADVVKLFAWTTYCSSTNNKDDSISNTTHRQQPELKLGVAMDDSSSSLSKIFFASLDLENLKENRSITNLRFLAVVPPRYFSMDIEAMTKKDVDVDLGTCSIRLGAGIKEAHHVSVVCTGNITGGNIQAMNVALDSRGGDIQMKQLTGSTIDIDSGGGGVDVKTLAAVHAHVNSRTGPMSVGACFIEASGLVECMNNTFHADSVRGGGQGLTVVKASEVAVGGVDGGIKVVDSRAVELQINEGCSDVEIDGSSNVLLYIAPTVIADVTLSNCGTEVQLPAVVQAQQQSSRKDAFFLHRNNNNISDTVTTYTTIKDGDQRMRNVREDNHVNVVENFILRPPETGRAGGLGGGSHHSGSMYVSPVSRLQRDGPGSPETQWSCSVKVRNTSHVRMEWRSWMQARLKAFASR